MSEFESYVREKLDAIEADVRDMAPRVQMLNDWHKDVDKWRQEVGNKLAEAATNDAWLTRIIYAVLGVGVANIIMRLIGG